MCNKTITVLINFSRLQQFWVITTRSALEKITFEKCEIMESSKIFECTQYLNSIFYQQAANCDKKGPFET